MPRPPRLLIDDACYHILTRGNNRAPVFFEELDRQRYGQWLVEFSQLHQVRDHVGIMVGESASKALVFCLQEIAEKMAQDPSLRQLIEGL